MFPAFFLRLKLLKTCSFEGMLDFSVKILLSLSIVDRGLGQKCSYKHQKHPTP